MGADNPYLPVYLPEFGASVSWAMCRNSMCANFGIRFEGEAPDGQRTISDGRCEIDTERGRFTCRQCRQSFGLGSNAAIREVARLYLKWSLPFADCPDTACANHGRNLFERHPAHARPSERPYARQGKDRAKCRACGQRFPLGTPLRLHVAKRAGLRAAKALHRDVVRYVAMGTNIFEAINAEDFGVGASAESYLAHLRSAGARLRDYVAWRNARLLAPRAAGVRGAVHVYTDIMTASLQRQGEAKRYQPLPIAVSAVRLAERRTDYIIAAHPGFMPMNERQVRTMVADVKRRRRAGDPWHESPWDCFSHPYRVDVTQSVEERFRNQPEFSRHGQYLVEQYMLLAHFLVLRKMLSRFPLVLHYLDGSKAQMGAALTALADETRAGRWEIAICQSNDSREDREDREPDADDFGQAGLGKSVDREWERRRKRWTERRVEKAGGLFEAGSEIDAQLHLEALRGGHSTKGGWAWLKHPPPGRRHNGGVSLWLTQRPNSSFSEVGRSLLVESSTLPVDRVHRQLRARVAALRRPGHRAKPGRGYEGARKSPITVLGELWIGLMRQGFVRRTSTRGDRVVRAEAMGIARAGERPNDTAEVAWDFQLDFGHAERISGWIGQ